MNNARRDYPRILVYAGAFATADDELFETSRIVRDFSLPAGSAELIEMAEAWRLDFISWYEVDLYRRLNTSPAMMFFAIPKGAELPGPIRRLPVIDSEGRFIPLEWRRDGVPVEEEMREAEREEREGL